MLIPLFGILSDRIGRGPVLIAATLGHLLLPFPLFAWVQAEPSFVRLLGLQVAMCGIVAVLFGPLSTVLAEQFPAAVRSTGMALAYNFAVTLFGGFAPFIVTWLIRETASPSAPAFYIMSVLPPELPGPSCLERDGIRSALLPLLDTEPAAQLRSTKLPGRGTLQAG